MESFAPLCLIVEFSKVVAQEFFLELAPTALTCDPLPGAFLFESPFAKSDGKLIQIAFKGVAGSRMVAYCLLVRMQEFSTLRA